MKITGANVERYRSDAPGDGPVPEILIVRIHTSAEVSGTGFVSTTSAASELYARVLQDILVPCVLEHDPRLTSELWQRMHQALPRRGGEGLVRACIAAIDFALWDIKGRLMDAPVSALFGAHRERIPTYANCAHHMPPDVLAERAASDVARGHRALKIRGTRTFVTPAEATARVEAVREAVGPDVKLMVDVNGTWDVDLAIDQLRRWEHLDVYWLEEPVPPLDVPGYRRVRERAGNTYIVGGEQLAGLAEFRALIDAGAVDMAQPNAAITGGITDWLQVHAYATARGVPVSPWDLQVVHLHMAAGLPNVKWIEYFMPDNALLAFQTRLFSKPEAREEITADGVFLLAPEGPGLGLELDPEVAERARVG